MQSAQQPWQQPVPGHCRLSSSHADDTHSSNTAASLAYAAAAAAAAAAATAADDFVCAHVRLLGLYCVAAGAVRRETAAAVPACKGSVLHGRSLPADCMLHGVQQLLPPDTRWRRCGGGSAPTAVQPEQQERSNQRLS